MLARTLTTLAVAYAMIGCSAEEAATQPQPEALTAAQQQVLTIQPNDRVLGNPKAPLLVVEYASFTCVHCANSHKTVFPELKRDYIDTGKIAFVLRPLPLDNIALAVSKLAYCVPAERFYNFAGAFFNSQNNWIPAPDRLAAIRSVARLGGMDDATFDRCLADEKLQTEILGVNNVGRDVMVVTSTPTTFVGHERIVGAQPYTTVKDAIERQLQKVAP